MRLFAKTKNNKKIYYLRDEDGANVYIKEYPDCTSKPNFYHTFLLADFEEAKHKTIKQRKDFVRELSYASLKDKSGWQTKEKK